MANAVSHKQSINHELARNSSYVKRPRKSRLAQEGPALQDGTGGGAIGLDSPATGLESDFAAAGGCPLRPRRAFDAHHSNVENRELGPEVRELGP